MSTIIRQAIEAYCDALMKDRLDQRLADVTGVVCSEGGRARSSGRAFLAAQQERRDSGKR
jgi:hypothetical protein